MSHVILLVMQIVTNDGSFTGAVEPPFSGMVECHAAQARYELAYNEVEVPEDINEVSFTCLDFEVEEVDA